MVSSKNEREPIKVPPDFAYASIEALHVREWRPTDDGSGSATEIHLFIHLKGAPDKPLVVRFTGPGTLDSLVSALVIHRLNVFGGFG